MRRSYRYRTDRAAEDTVLAVQFPGDVVARERWTRTRTPLGQAGGPFDWDATFGRTSRRVLDLGCGNGRYLVASALARPGCDHLGLDLVPPSIKFASLRAGQRGLTNVRFAWCDASEFVCSRLATSSVDEIHIYHPQPYADRSRAALRQLTPRVLLAIYGALRPGGVFVFQTDNDAYARYARGLVPSLFEWRERDGPWPDAPLGRTLREIVARDQGLSILRAEAFPRGMSLVRAEAIAAGLPEPDFQAGRRARRS